MSELRIVGAQLINFQLLTKEVLILASCFVFSVHKFVWSFRILKTMFWLFS